MALRGTQAITGDAAVRAMSAGSAGAAVLGDAAIQTIRASAACQRRRSRGRPEVDIQGNEITPSENSLHLSIQSNPGTTGGNATIDADKGKEEKE